MKPPANRTLVADLPDCDIYLWKAGQPMDIFLPVVSEITPVEIHIKPDGAVDDRPSFCFVMETQVGVCVVAQISFETLWPAIEAAIKCKGDLS